jgi:hypothetical protein
MKTIDIKGNVNKQNESDTLTISAYSSYNLLKKITAAHYKHFIQQQCHYNI